MPARWARISSTGAQVRSMPTPIAAPSGANRNPDAAAPAIITTAAIEPVRASDSLIAPHRMRVPATYATSPPSASEPQNVIVAASG